MANGRDGNHVPTQCISGQLSLRASGPLACKASVHARDHTIPIFFAQAGAGRETEALVEEAGADLAAMHFSGSEDGLEVHGLPDGTGFDVLGFEGEADLLAGDTSNRRIDGQAGEPAGGLSPGGFRLHGHTGETLEGFGVGLEVPTATRDFAGEARELAETDTGGNITETIVIPDGGMLVVRSSVACLGGEEARLLGELSVIGDEHAAAAGGDDLITIEGMDAE